MLHQRAGRVFRLIRTLFCCFLWIIPVVYLVYSLVIIFFLAHHSYAAVQQYYSTRWPGAFDPETMAAECFTPSWYAWVRGHSGLLIVLIK